MLVYFCTQPLLAQKMVKMVKAAGQSSKISLDIATQLLAQLGHVFAQQQLWANLCYSRVQRKGKQKQLFYHHLMFLSLFTDLLTLLLKNFLGHPVGIKVLFQDTEFQSGSRVCMLVSCLTHDIQPDYHNKRRKVADVALSRLLSSVPKRAPQKGKKCLLTLSTIAFLPPSNFRTIEARDQT